MLRAQEESGGVPRNPPVYLRRIVCGNLHMGVPEGQRGDPWRSRGLPYGGAHITHVVASTHVCCLQAIASGRRHFFFFVAFLAAIRRCCSLFHSHNLGQQSQAAHMCNHVQDSARSPQSMVSCPAPASLVATPFWHLPLALPGKHAPATSGACSGIVLCKESPVRVELEFRKRADRTTWTILKRICLVSNGSGASGWRRFFPSTKKNQKEKPR